MLFRSGFLNFVAINEELKLEYWMRNDFLNLHTIYYPLNY